jgi:hypothetical protein
MWQLASIAGQFCDIPEKHRGLRGREGFLLFFTLEFNQGWEEQDHVPALIHDRGSAVCTADLAG